MERPLRVFFLSDQLLEADGGLAVRHRDAGQVHESRV
jgi:hypothetical protein